MLVDVEQVMRVAFRAVGQTELARWLSDLSAKDGVPPLTRAQPPAVNDTVVMDRPPHDDRGEDHAPPPLPGKTAARAATAARASGTESGVELDLDGADAALVAAPPRDPATPPPPPPPPRRRRRAADAEHVTSLRPLPFWQAAIVPQARGARGRRRLLLAIAVAALQVARSHEPRDARIVAAASPAPRPRRHPRQRRRTRPQRRRRRAAAAPAARTAVAAAIAAPTRRGDRRCRRRRCTRRRELATATPPPATPKPEPAVAAADDEAKEPATKAARPARRQGRRRRRQQGDARRAREGRCQKAADLGRDQERSRRQPGQHAPPHVRRHADLAQAAAGLLRADVHQAGLSPDHEDRAGRQHARVRSTSR